MTIPIVSKEPNTGRLQKEDNTVINVADLSGGNSVVFQNAITSGANGTIVSVGGFKSLRIEIFGTATASAVLFMGIGESGVARPLQGVRMSDFAVAISTTTIGEFWQFDITGLVSVQMQVTAVSGGNISVTGIMLG